MQKNSLAVPAKRLLATFLDVFVPFIVYMILGAIGGGGDSASVLIFLGFLITLILQIKFFANGQSIGKKISGIVVVNQKSNDRLGFFAMLIRDTIGKAISGFIFSLGYIWILIDDDNQAWHDKFMNSVVIDE